MSSAVVGNVVLGFVVGLGLGAALVWFLMRSQAAALQSRCRQAEEQLREALAAKAGAEALAQRLPELERQVANLQEENTRLQREAAALEQARRADAEKIQWVEQARQSLRDMFQALAGQALRTNAQEFLQRSRDALEALLKEVRGDWQTQRAELQGLVRPLDEALKALDNHLREMEIKREGAYESLRQQVQQLQQTSSELQGQTHQLLQALRSGHQQRGQWAEFQLRRLVEMAGMQEHVDFNLQVSGEAGRPDMLVHLPGGGCVIIDAKAPMTRYLEALEAENENRRRQCLQGHAQILRQHIDSLAQKEYWHQFGRTPEFVVMFIPNEPCLSAAFEMQPDLLEYAYRQRIALATPTTLFALLKTVAFGWQQHKIAENARRIADEGKELFHRLSNFIVHLQKIGRRLEQTVSAYNEAVGSYNHRLAPAVDRFTKLGGIAATPPEIYPVEGRPQPLQPPEMPA